jgi:hypothetical protein
MFVTIINDCRDDNAAGRQLTRAHALFGAPATLIGVGSVIEDAHGQSDLEAAGNLVDVLDAGEGKEGVVLVNVAPRHAGAKRWPNGTPFCYFRYGETLVLASIDGLTLSLAKKLGLLEDVTVFDVQGASAVFAQAGIVAPEEAVRIAGSQFRSFDILPRAALAFTRGVDVPGELLPLSEISDAPRGVWFVDGFGNCKTTLLSEDLANTHWLSIGDRRIPFVASLKDVPDAEAAAIIGSSGIANRRFVEIVVQGTSAAETLGLKVGSLI